MQKFPSFYVTISFFSIFNCKPNPHLDTNKLHQRLENIQIVLCKVRFFKIIMTKQKTENNFLFLKNIETLTQNNEMKLLSENCGNSYCCPFTLLPTFVLQDGIDEIQLAVGGKHVSWLLVQ